MKTIEKIFSPWVLLALNAVIIFAAELFGGGEFFIDSGLIHAAAIAFIILSVSRIYEHYHTFDAFLEKMVHASLAAMAIFGFSHIVEFLSYKVFNLHEDAIFANVANFYILSMLLISLGAEYFLKKHDHRRPFFSWAIVCAASVAAFLIFLFSINDKIVSLEEDSPLLPIYIIAILFCAAFVIWQLARIKRTVSITKSFAGYLIAAIGLISFSAIFSILYEIWEEVFGMPDHQIVYVSHFTFYGALSLMFLAFVRLANLPGIYAAIQEQRQAPPLRPSRSAGQVLIKKKSSRTKKSAL